MIPEMSRVFKNMSDKSAVFLTERRVQYISCLMFESGLDRKVFLSLRIFFQLNILDIKRNENHSPGFFFYTKGAALKKSVQVQRKICAVLNNFASKK